MTVELRGRLVRHDERSRDCSATTAPLRNVAGNVRNSLMLMKYGPQARLLGDRECAAIYSRATLDDPFDGCWPPTDTGSSGLGAARAMKQLRLIGGYRHAFGLQARTSCCSSRPATTGTSTRARTARSLGTAPRPSPWSRGFGRCFALARPWPVPAPRNRLWPVLARQPSGAR